jgi:ferritin-like metal-binding protein YciE
MRGFLRSGSMERSAATRPQHDRLTFKPFLAMSPTQQLVTWLNSVHAIELSLAQTLQNHANDARDLPEISVRIASHVAETRRHADLVERCLALLGEKPAMVKSTLGNLMGMMQAPSTGVFRDELMKNALMDFAAENLEIASYRALIAAADELGQPDIAEICRGILIEEEAMAEWLEEQIPTITRLMLQQVTQA